MKWSKIIEFSGTWIAQEEIQQILNLAFLEFVSICSELWKALLLDKFVYFYGDCSWNRHCEFVFWLIWTSHCITTLSFGETKITRQDSQIMIHDICTTLKSGRLKVADLKLQEILHKNPLKIAMKFSAIILSNKINRLCHKKLLLEPALETAD